MLSLVQGSAQSQLYSSQTFLLRRKKRGPHIFSLSVILGVGGED